MQRLKTLDIDFLFLQDIVVSQAVRDPFELRTRVPNSCKFLWGYSLLKVANFVLVYMRHEGTSFDQVFW